MAARVLHIRVSGASRYKCGAPLWMSSPPSHRARFEEDVDADAAPMCSACEALSLNARANARALAALARLG